MYNGLGSLYEMIASSRRLQYDKIQAKKEKNSSSSLKEREQSDVSAKMLLQMKDYMEKAAECHRKAMSINMKVTAVTFLLLLLVTMIIALLLSFL